MPKHDKHPRHDTHYYRVSPCNNLQGPERHAYRVMRGRVVAQRCQRRALCTPVLPQPRPLVLSHRVPVCPLALILAFWASVVHDFATHEDVLSFVKRAH
jgi:hypothetical protein